jgi:hypothetical protein
MEQVLDLAGDLLLVGDEVALPGPTKDNLKALLPLLLLLPLLQLLKSLLLSLIGLLPLLLQPSLAVAFPTLALPAYDPSQRSRSARLL